MSAVLRQAAKDVAFWLATLVVLPALVSFAVRARLLGRDRAIEGSSEALSRLPGIAGQYLRRAFYARTLAGFHRSATIGFGVLFSKAGARIDENVYVGPRCHLGLVHIERDALIGPAVHVPSGRATHGTTDPDRPIREQDGVKALVTIGAGAWIGAAAVVMADVGRAAVVGAGSVVTTIVPDAVVAAGVPAKVLRGR